MITYPFRFASALFRRGFKIPSKPFLVNYSVTFRCNLKCRYCGISGNHSACLEDELNAKDIINFLRDPFLERLDAVIISGGEPFLKEDIADILLAFHKSVKPRIFHITTNGYLTESIADKIKFLKSKGLHIDLKISIDDCGHRHDKLRGREGCFDRAVDTARRLRRNFSDKQLFIGINQTIFEDNYQSIPEMRRLAKELGADYRGFVGLKSRPLYENDAACDFGLTELSSQAREYILREFGKTYFNKPSLGLENIVLRHYVSGQMRIISGQGQNRHYCMNLFTHFRLNPNGDIITCSYDTHVLGNIKGESYSSILKKAKAAGKLDKVRQCGKCWLGCEVTPNWVSSLGL